MPGVTQEIVLHRHAGESVTGSADGGWVFPGAALSASTSQYFHGAVTDIDFANLPTLRKAYWMLVWNPRSFNANAASVRMIKFDDGPNNIENIGLWVRRSNTVSPVVDGQDITASIQQLIDAGTSKHIGYQIAGNGNTAPLIFSSVLYLTWGF